MFFSNMDLAITPLLLLSSHLRGAACGSTKAFYCLLLLSCLLLSSVNTLHNLAEYDSCGVASTGRGFQSYNGVAIQNVCPSSHLFSFLSALGLENQFDPIATFFGLSWSNNLSDVVWLSLRPVHIIEFQPQLLSPVNIRDNTCYKPLSKGLFGKDTGELSILVSGGNGFKQCQGFSLEPIKFMFFYQTDSDLELSWSSGIGALAVPMKSTAPVLMLNIGKKTVFWVRTKKFSIAVLLLAALLLVLVFCFSDHFVEEENNKRNNSSSHIAVRKVEKKTSTFTISPEMDSILRSISSETMQAFVNNGNKDKVSKNSEVSKNSVKPAEEEASEAVNLSVKTAKRRRNKKKKKSAVRELTSERTDVSSSHSGTSSTPSSPMSPEPTTNQTTTKPVKPPKPVLSHSATFPVSAVKSMMIERSSLAPNVRAPGTKSRIEMKEEKATKEYRYYDIWGDHLTGLNLMDRFKEVREGKSSSGFGEDESESFFVKGPQNYLVDSHARFVSFCNQWG